VDGSYSDPEVGQVPDVSSDEDSSSIEDEEEEGRSEHPPPRIDLRKGIRGLYNYFK